MQDNERLLKLYESGLPAWAVYAPQYGEYKLGNVQPCP